MSTIEVAYYCFRAIIEIAKLVIKYTNLRKTKKKGTS